MCWYRFYYVSLSSYSMASSICVCTDQIVFIWCFLCIVHVHLCGVLSLTCIALVYMYISLSERFVCFVFFVVYRGLFLSSDRRIFTAQTCFCNFPFLFFNNGKRWYMQNITASPKHSFMPFICTCTYTCNLYFIRLLPFSFFQQVTGICNHLFFKLNFLNINLFRVKLVFLCDEKKDHL